MEYKAQLVIRSRDRDGVGVIEQIKELASLADKTYSDMALELLGLGLQRQGDDSQTSAAQPAAPTAAESRAPTVEISGARPAAETESDAKTATPTPNFSADTPVAEVAEQCLKQIEADQPQAAAKTLAGFFANVGPIQGGEIKSALQGRLKKSDYDLLLKNLRQTQEYRSYRQRVIFER
jgi:hypothetical protein